MLRAERHHREHAVHELERHGLVEQVAHTVHEHAHGLPPLQWVAQAVGQAPHRAVERRPLCAAGASGGLPFDGETDVRGLAHRGEAVGHDARVAEVAAGRDGRAAD